MLCSAVLSFLKRGKRNYTELYFFVILSAKHERIRNSSFKRERIAAHLTAVSPAGSVGASASQRCPPDTRTAMTKRPVILNAKRERIRIPLERERIATAVYTASQ